MNLKTNWVLTRIKFEVNYFKTKLAGKPLTLESEIKSFVDIEC